MIQPTPFPFERPSFRRKKQNDVVSLREAAWCIANRNIKPPILQTSKLEIWRFGEFFPALKIIFCKKQVLKKR